MQDRLSALTKADIEAMIPHAGGMCLLDRVMYYSPEEIICQTQTHLDDNNPLKNDGHLSKMHLIEYGAQAVAVHGGLMASLEAENADKSEPKLGYIAMIKSVKWGDFNPDTPLLEIKATSMMADEISKLYEFYITDAEQQLVCSARVMVVHPNLEV